MANCGYGHGFSVREVLDAARRVTGVDFPIEEGPRRAGDPAVLVADSRHIKALLGWAPRHDDLDCIVATGLALGAAAAGRARPAGPGVLSRRGVGAIVAARGSALNPLASFTRVSRPGGRPSCHDRCDKC